MGQALGKPELFSGKKDFVFFLVFCVLLLFIRLSFLYVSYQAFISKPFYYTTATVLSAYEKSKHHKQYTVLKLHSDEGLTFYTTSHRKENFNHTRLRLQIFPNSSISFIDYLGTFYVKSKIKDKALLDPSLKDSFVEKVASQHKNAALASFYNAIFFATPLDKQLREKIALLGVSHLVALSGFHISILWALVYGLLLLLYRPLQQKYFPYRHALFDVGLLAMILLGLYVWFVGFPPSLLRSYAMVLFGWMALVLGIELLSFTFLGTVLALLVVLLPSLLVSLSFGLSVAGVFYIYLLLQYTKKWKTWVLTLLVIPVGIFVLMLPIVHETFAVTSPCQLASPILSLLFIVFYPLVMFLHLLGMGDSFDSLLLALFSLPQTSTEHFVPLWLMLGYVGLSLMAIRSAGAFYFLLAVASGYAGYLFLY